MGAHHARHSDDSRTMRRVAMAVIAPIAALTLAAMVVLWPTESIAPAEQSAAEQVSGQVISVDPQPCPENSPEGFEQCGTAQVRLTESADGSPESDQAFESPLPSGPGAPEIAAGDDVVLMVLGADEGGGYAIIDHRRGTGLWLLAVAFALAMVAFGRWRGFTALLGLAVTFAVLVFFVVPAILAGEAPLIVAIVGSSAIMLTVLYLTHGFSLSTTVAVLGTLISLTLTGLLSAVSVSALHLSGITDDISTSVGLTYDVNMQGLLLAGIVIGALGVLDDVTVTQAATVAELARANPAYGFRQLYRAGSSVGRSHIASVVNTIILAYAGTSLPLLILIVASRSSLGSVVTDQVIAQEIVRSVVATLGLVAAVPVTTGLAALTAGRVRESAPGTSTGDGEG